MGTVMRGVMVMEAVMGGDRGGDEDGDGVCVMEVEDVTDVCLHQIKVLVCRLRGRVRQEAGAKASLMDPFEPTPRDLKPIRT